MEHQDLTGEILGACFEVVNELGQGFVESVCENGLLIALADRGLQAEAQFPLQVHFRGQVVGDFIADIVVEGKVVVELKAASALAPGHQAQLINYLNATGIEVGLLVNFGGPRLDYRRCHRSGAVEQEP
jgi:GxxExxY protein